MIRFLMGIFIVLAGFQSGAREIRVGSKSFTEGYLLGELAAQKIESNASVSVERKFGLGSTGVAVQALLRNEIDVYPEYTGTISEAILRDSSAKSFSENQTQLSALGLVMSNDLGFQNSYSLAVRRDYAKSNQLDSISDLSRVEQTARCGFSHEFLGRSDGYSILLRKYKLAFRQPVQGVDHILAYKLLEKRNIDLIATYSTDSLIDEMDLVLLKDDLNYFPQYRAVYLARKEFVEKNPDVWDALNSLSGSINEVTVRGMNRAVEQDKLSFRDVVARHLRTDETLDLSHVSIYDEIFVRTREHLLLVLSVLVASVFFGVSLGILASRNKSFGRLLVAVTSLIQTIPSLALLALLIPVFGIGKWPALIALFLYGLLPVVMSTMVGLQSIAKEYLETARAIGMTSARILVWIELPMASRVILGGLKSSTIIAIGNAALAALIGAGGYGALILRGLATSQTEVILAGSIPCALMAVVASACFELLDFLITPRGLR